MEYIGNQLGRVCNFCIKYIMLAIILINNIDKNATTTKSH